MMRTMTTEMRTGELISVMQQKRKRWAGRGKGWIGREDPPASVTKDGTG